MLNYCYSQKLIFFPDGNILYKQYSIKMGQDKQNKSTLISLEDDAVIDTFMREKLILYEETNTVSLLSFVPAPDKVEGNGQILLHIQPISPALAKDPMLASPRSQAFSTNHSIVSRVSLRSTNRSDFTSKHELPLVPVSSPISPFHQQPISPLHQQPTSPPHQQPISPFHQQPISPFHQQPISPPHQQPISPLHQQPTSPPHQPISPLHQQPISLPHQQPISPLPQPTLSSEALTPPANSTSELNVLFSTATPLQEMATHFTYGPVVRHSTGVMRLSEGVSERESAFTQNIESEEEWFFQRSAEVKQAVPAVPTGAGKPKPLATIGQALPSDSSSEDDTTPIPADTHESDELFVSSTSESASTPLINRVGWKQLLPMGGNAGKTKSHDAEPREWERKNSVFSAHRSSRGFESSSDEFLTARVTASDASLPDDMKRKMRESRSNEHCQYFGCFRMASAAGESQEAMRCSHCFFVFCEEVNSCARPHA